MAYTLADLTSWAQQASGKEDDPSISSARWLVLIDAAIKYAFKKVAAQFGDSWIAFTDFSLTTAVNTAPMPSNFGYLRHVTKDPTLTSRMPIPRFSMQAIDDYTGPRYRVMGRVVYVDPPEVAAGNYRAWFTPRPMQFAGDFTVRVATASLPSCTSAGAGPGKTLTEVGNGALVALDGVSMAVGDRFLLGAPAGVQNPTQYGIYTVTSLGSAGTPWVVTRATDYDQAGVTEVRDGAIIRPTEGTANANVPYILSGFGAAGIVDTTAQTYTAATLDTVLDPHAELIVYEAAAAALEGEKSDSSQQRAHIAELVEDLTVDADSQDAGGQTAIYDVDEFSDPRLQRRPLP